MRILITGALGQLGKALQNVLSSHELALADLPDVDITDRQGFINTMELFRPHVVIHCAAYTNVDGSVSNPQLAFEINGLGTQNVALACDQVGAAMVHLSTNEVFAGNKPGGYEEWMPADPINPYGRSKALGEFFVQNLLNRFYIVRTAWLYAPGGKNFIHSILHHSQQNGQLKVVADEVGNPTYVTDLANAIARLIKSGQFGYYHLVNEGACSRYEFAKEILRLSGFESLKITPILSSEYARASTPPPYGKLKNISANSIGITLRPWQKALEEYISDFVT